MQELQSTLLGLTELITFSINSIILPQSAEYIFSKQDESVLPFFKEFFIVCQSPVFGSFLRCGLPKFSIFIRKYNSTAWIGDGSTSTLFGIAIS